MKTTTSGLHCWKGILRTTGFVPQQRWEWHHHNDFWQHHSSMTTNEENFQEMSNYTAIHKYNLYHHTLVYDAWLNLIQAHIINRKTITLHLYAIRPRPTFTQNMKQDNWVYVLTDQQEVFIQLVVMANKPFNTWASEARIFDCKLLFGQVKGPLSLLALHEVLTGWIRRLYLNHFVKVARRACGCHWKEVSVASSQQPCSRAHWRRVHPTIKSTWFNHVVENKKPLHAHACRPTHHFKAMVQPSLWLFV